jgi:hypothetical protein
MERVVLVVLLLSAPQTAVGHDRDIKKDLAACASLDIETARLDCFEQLARAITQIPFKAADPRASKSRESARDVPTVSPSEAANHIGEEVVVEGVISDVGFSARSDTTFLNMGGKYPNHVFTAVILRSAKPLFPEARAWEGKRVRIRGAVKEYQGKPEIVLERTEQVTVVK